MNFEISCLQKKKLVALLCLFSCLCLFCHRGGWGRLKKVSTSMARSCWVGRYLVDCAIDPSYKVLGLDIALFRSLLSQRLPRIRIQIQIQSIPSTIINLRGEFRHSLISDFQSSFLSLTPPLSLSLSLSLLSQLDMRWKKGETIPHYQSDKSWREETEPLCN